MLVRYFLILNQIESTMEDKWKSKITFADFKATLDTLSEDETKIQEEKIKQFLQIVVVSITKYFWIWISKDLLLLSLFSEQNTAKWVARHLLGMLFINGEISVSVIHDMSINITNFNQFLVKYCAQDKVCAIRNSLLYTNTLVPIWLIVSDYDIWDKNKTPDLLLFADLYRFNYSFLPTSSQLAERGVKESGYVTLGRRSEKNRFALAMYRENTISDAKATRRFFLVKAMKENSVQGKLWAKMLINEAIRHQSLIDKMLIEDRQFLVAQKRIHNDLTSDERQFKNNELTKSKCV